MASEAGELFDDLPECETRVQSARSAKGPARVLMPNRLQIELRPSDLESLLPEGHRARIVWGYVERQDLNGMYKGIKAREGGAGRSAIAPEILFALWLYATLENEGRAREVARLTQAHDAYRWICGGVRVNHHTLSDFRVDHAQALDDLLCEPLPSGAGPSAADPLALLARAIGLFRLLVPEIRKGGQGITWLETTACLKPPALIDRNLHKLLDLSCWRLGRSGEFKRSTFLMPSSMPLAHVSTHW